MTMMMTIKLGKNMKTNTSFATPTCPNTVAWRLRTACAARLLPLLLLTLPAAVQAQDYTYTTNNGAITITGYTGSGGAVDIPGTITGLPVTSIGYEAFYYCTSLTSVTIPNSVTSIEGGAFNYCTSLTSVTIGNSVTSIGNDAFNGCTSLTAITVDALNSVYSSVAGVLFNKSQTTLIQCPRGKAGSYAIPNSVTSIGGGAFDSCTSLTNVTIPDSVTSIGNDAFSECRSLTSVTIGNSVTSIGYAAFDWCTSLTSVTIPNSVTSIGSYAFYSCTSLTGAYFKGNAPGPGINSSVFLNDNNAMVYYLPGTTGWPTVPNAWAGRPTALWSLPNPLILNGPSFGVQTNQFGFIISWATNISVVVEACTNLANPIWTPLQTNTLTGGSSYFSDPDWTNYPGRFYRLRSP
jgi:hypothetical protein